MKINNIQKFGILGLLLYIPTIFVLTHIPIPKMVRTAGVSDKMMHFLAYMILAFFLWMVISSEKRVHWLKSRVWIAIGISLLYSIADEYLQTFVNRNANILDLTANMAGVFTCLIILTIFNFWSAAMLVWGLLMFLLPNFTMGNLLSQSQWINSCYHFFGFAVFTMLWIQILDRYLPMKNLNFKWPLTAAMIPMLMLAAIKLLSTLMNKQVWVSDIVTSVIAIITVIIISWPTGVIRNKIQRKKYDNAAYKW